MNKRRVHIENLTIRIPQSSAGQACAIAGGIGKEILHGIAESTAGNSGTKKIGEISAGKTSMSGGAVAPELKKKIAGRVAEEIRKRFD